MPNGCKVLALFTTTKIYYKDVASKSMINARSALPWSCKRTILTQEVLRILLNCSRELPWETMRVLMGVPSYQLTTNFSANRLVSNCAETKEQGRGSGE